MPSPNDRKTKADFLLFMQELRADLRANPTQWENKTLPGFLAALEGCATDLEGHYHHLGQTVPPIIRWDVFATILQAASIYE